MFPNINPTHTTAWQALQQPHEEMKTVQMKNLFATNPERYNRFSLATTDFIFDYSKNIINEKTVSLLIQLANECGLPDAINAMFAGEKINVTENRAVLHTALRNFSGKPVLNDGRDVMPDVKAVLEQMKNFCGKVHNGEWKGYTGKKIKYIVNIGIGGSDLGPVMVTEALKPYWVNTSDNVLIKKLLLTSSAGFKERLEILLSGNSVERILDENFVEVQIFLGLLLFKFKFK